MRHYQGRPSHQGMMYQSALQPPVLPMKVSSHRLQNINCIFEATTVLGGLYLGDIISTLKPQLLKQHRINAILSCMSERTGLTVLMPLHKTLPLQDNLQCPINYYFDDAAEWIDSRRKEGCNVLVHCHAGVSRSATIIIAYLMLTKGWSPPQALEFVRTKRERAKPNTSFWSQLHQFHIKISSNGNQPLRTQHHKTKEAQVSPVESKQNIQNKVRASEPLTSYLKTEPQLQFQSKERQFTQRQNLSIFVHQPKSQIRKRKKIFDLPASDPQQFRKYNVVSSEPSAYISDHKRNSHSILFPNLKSSLINPPPKTPETSFRESKSTLDVQPMSHQPVKVVPSHGQLIQFSNAVKVHYQSPQPQPYVSPFQVRSQLRNP